MNSSPLLQIQKCYLPIVAWLFPLACVMAQTPPVAETTYSTVHIQGKPLEYRQFEKVEITGSSIVRKEQTQALPVQVITRDDIRRSGSNSIADVLQNIPMMSMVVTSAAMTTSIGGYTTASLRSLPAGTLLLLNGKRLAPYGRQTVNGVDRPSVDINTIPLSAIEKIEILSDGASSLYGTDAIAGVINIMTRVEQKGVEIAVEKMVSAQGGGSGEQVSLNAGTGNLRKDGYNFRMTAEFNQREALNAKDRPQYAQGRYIVERQGQQYAIDGSRLTSYASPGVFSVPADTRTGQRRQVYSLLYDNGRCPENYVPMIGQPSCQYNSYTDLTIYPRQESRKILMTGEKPLSNNAVGYAEFLYSHLKDGEFSGQGWRQLVYSLGSSPTAVGYQQAIDAGLDPSKVQFLWSPSLLPGLKREYQQSNWRMATGVKGEWNQWDYHANVYRAQSTVTRQLEFTDFVGQGLVSGGLLTDQNMLKPLTPDNPLTHTLNGLRDVWNIWDIGKTQTTAVNFRTSRPLMEIDGKDVMLGMGLEWRHELTDFEHVSNNQLQPSFQASRDIKAGYLELQLPLTQQWDVNISTRRDHYSDFGGTQNSKLASRFDFQNGWSARASWGTGFRAPSVAQMQDFDELYLTARTTYNTECSAALREVAAGLMAANGQPARCVDRTPMNIYGTGNPNLKPELARQKSLGLAYRPIRNFSVTADWWSIDMRDLISTLSDQLVYSDPSNNSIHFMAESNGTLAMKLPNYNMGKREKRGLDFDVRWRKPTDMGQLNFFIQGTYNIKSQDQRKNTDPFTSDLGRYNPLTDSITPRLRTRWIVGLTNARWSLHGVVNHTSGYVDQDRNGTNIVTGQSLMLTGFRVPSFTTLDVNASHQISKAVNIRATIGNILNRQAPQAFTSTAPQVFGFNTREHNLWGRTFSVALIGKF
jgi:iron complex outermembrane receptor protein